jgi:hypothetical protein
MASLSALIFNLSLFLVTHNIKPKMGNIRPQVKYDLIYIAEMKASQMLF